MNTNVDERGSAADTAKLVFALLLLAAGIFGFYRYEPQLAQWMRVLGLVGVGLVALIIAAQTARGRALVAFLREAYVEIQKVVWPTRAETVQTTLLVLAVTVVIGLLLWLMDTLLGWGVGILYGYGS